MIDALYGLAYLLLVIAGLGALGFFTADPVAPTSPPAPLLLAPRASASPAPLPAQAWVCRPLQEPRQHPVEVLVELDAPELDDDATLLDVPIHVEPPGGP